MKQCHVPCTVLLVRLSLCVPVKKKDRSLPRLRDIHSIISSTDEEARSRMYFAGGKAVLC
jgi:hypothetical protein